MSQEQNTSTEHVPTADNTAGTKDNVLVAARPASGGSTTPSNASKTSPLPSPPLPEPVTQTAGLSAAAHDASAQEHSMGVMQALSIYKKGIGWCAVYASSVVMQSYDIAIVPSLFGQEEFCKKYGVLSRGGKYEIPARWKTGLVDGALVGEQFGLLLSGIVSEKYGYKKTMVVALLAATGFVFIPFFAGSIGILLLGQVLNGIPWGMFQSLPSSYASDVMPAKLRAIVTTFINLCWVFGQLKSSIVLRFVLPIHNEWAYRIPFAIQWSMPLVIAALIAVSPESPVWLVRHGRVDEARRSLTRMTTPGNSQFSVHNVIDLISETNRKEIAMSAGTSYFDCFRGVNTRRTRIAAITWSVQALCGSVILGYSLLFYLKCGLPTEWAFNMAMIQYTINVIGAVTAWFFMSLAGRRSLYLFGSKALLILLVTIGATAFTSQDNGAASWAMAIQYLLFTFVYSCTVGPVCFSLVTEMSSMRLKTKTIALARASYNIASIIVNCIASYQLTSLPEGWGWGAKAALFWAAITLGCVIWIYFDLPEPKGRTYHEMDVLFEHGVSARKFSKTNVAELEARHGESGSTGAGNAAGDSDGVQLANLNERTNV